jgi:hypothetical protein
VVRYVINDQNTKGISVGKNNGVVGVVIHKGVNKRQVIEKLPTTLAPIVCHFGRQS